MVISSWSCRRWLVAKKNNNIYFSCNAWFRFFFFYHVLSIWTMWWVLLQKISLSKSNNRIRLQVAQLCAIRTHFFTMWKGVWKKKKMLRQPGLRGHSQKTLNLLDYKMLIRRNVQCILNFDTDTLPKRGTENKVSVNDKCSDFIRIYIQLWCTRQYFLFLKNQEKASMVQSRSLWKWSNVGGLVK